MADFADFGSRSAATDSTDGPWYRGMTRYHWFVLTVAALGWLFDCLDQQLFNLARKPSISSAGFPPASFSPGGRREA
jgi:hypothetical protein